MKTFRNFFFFSFLFFFLNIGARALTPVVHTSCWPTWKEMQFESVKVIFNAYFSHQLMVSLLMSNCNFLTELFNTSCWSLRLLCPMSDVVWRFFDSSALLHIHHAASRGFQLLILYNHLLWFSMVIIEYNYIIYLLYNIFYVNKKQISYLKQEFGALAHCALLHSMCDLKTA